MYLYPATAPNYRDFSPPGGVGAYHDWASSLLEDRPCPGLWLVANAVPDVAGDDWFYLTVSRHLA